MTDRRFKVTFSITETSECTEQPFYDVVFHELSYKSLVELEQVVGGAILHLGQESLKQAR